MIGIFSEEEMKGSIQFKKENILSLYWAI